LLCEKEEVELIWILPERRKDKDRITQEALRNWSEKVYLPGGDIQETAAPMIWLSLLAGIQLAVVS